MWNILLYLPIFCIESKSQLKGFVKKVIWTFLCVLGSISPTFYAQLFCAKVLREAFLYLHFKFELLLAKEHWHKCAYKMLVKLTTAYSIRAVSTNFNRNGGGIKKEMQILARKSVCLYVCVCVCVCLYVCVSVCVWMRERKRNVCDCGKR